jgi:hypothetical protein
MHEVYEHRRLRLRPRGWKDLATAVAGPVREAVEAAGGRLFGLWRGQIGLGAGEGVLLTSWPDEESVGGAVGESLRGVPALVESHAERLVATARPTDPKPPPETDGVWALRRFEIDPRDWSRFLALSVGAWPEFETSYGSRIIGLWRSLDAPPDRASVLLMTRYPSLAVWEESRAGTGSPNFAERAQLTRDTVVVTTARVAL